MNFDYRLVDVFANRPFLGNPVAVVLGAAGLTADQMQTITRWMNLSETTFVLEPEHPEADYRLRIFTLDRELPFAGHPTLGSCAAWLSAGNRPRRTDRVIQECGAGLVPIRRVDGKHAFAAPPILRYEKPDDDKIDEVCAFLGINREDIVDMQWIDNGPGWLGVRLDSAERVLAVAPASRHPGRIEVGLVGQCPPGADYQFEVRALFTDQHGGVLEDPVTGSLNASLAQWLLDTGVAAAPFVNGQGRALGRDGRISVTVADGDVWIAGDTTVVVAGQLTVPP